MGGALLHPIKEFHKIWPWASLQATALEEQTYSIGTQYGNSGAVGLDVV